MLAQTRKVSPRAGDTSIGTRSERAFLVASIPSVRASALRDPGVGKFAEALEDCALELLAEALIRRRTVKRSYWPAAAA